MRRRLFEDLVVSRPAGRVGRRTYTLPLSIAIHGAVLGVALVLPMLGPDDMPMPTRNGPIVDVVFAADVRPPAPQPPARPTGPSRATGGPRPVVPHGAPPPVEEPNGFTNETGGPEIPVCLGPNCVPDGEPRPGDEVGIGAPNDGDGSPAPRRVDGHTIKPPVKIRDVAPVYPEVPRRAGVQGVVIIECTIDTTGRVVGAQVLSGHPMLAPAALDAVQRWIYVPTLLNGSPVSVIMTVTVRFTLNR